MTRHRHALPQLGSALFLTDGGIETTLVFHEGLDLPDFAAFHLLQDEAGRAALDRYFRTYAAIAARHRTGLVLESATWRASRDWGDRLGYDGARLAEANRRAVAILEALRAEIETAATRVVVSGCVGPRGDGYVPGRTMSPADAATYHGEQIDVFAATGVDMVTAITMNYADEAVGVAQAARRAGMPVAISFTVETDGRLPTGQSLADAVQAVDAATAAHPSYYMINCAHPTHFDRHVTAEAAWTGRVRGLRANASRQSHAELNEASELDVGDPHELAAQYAELKRRLPALTVLGGCCGTDHRHVERIAEVCVPLFPSRA